MQLGRRDIEAGETITLEGTLSIGGAFSGELCYAYTLEGASQDGALASKSYSGSCDGAAWARL